jgi:hypothetical protein
MSNNSNRYDINLQRENSEDSHKETCNYNNCENIGTEEIQVKAGDQVLTLLLCKLHVGEFQE